MTPNADQAHASITITATAGTLLQRGFTAHVNTAVIVAQCVGGDVRMTLNGTTPTASLGIRLVDGDMIELEASEFEVAKFILAASSPKLEIVGYLEP
jgi:hypothetical protein